MSEEKNRADVDLTRIMIRPLYFGLFANIMVPAALLLVCYFLQDKGLENKLGDAANVTFVVFCVIAAAMGVGALWWRSKLLNMPAVKAKATFEEDLRDALILRLRPVLVLVSAISLLGFSYFFLTGKFTEALIFVLASFVLFQIIRPRYGSVQSWADYQQELVEQGRFYTFKENR